MTIKKLGIATMVVIVIAAMVVVAIQNNTAEALIGAGGASSHERPAARFIGRLPRQFEVFRLLNHETAYVRDQNGACFLAYITWNGIALTEYAGVDSAYCQP